MYGAGGRFVQLNFVLSFKPRLVNVVPYRFAPPLVTAWRLVCKKASPEFQAAHYPEGDLTLYRAVAEASARTLMNICTDISRATAR